MKSPTITLDRLKEVVSYNQNTGEFIWVGRGRGIRTGKRAGSVDPNGYRVIRINKTDYLAQRLAWFWVHGIWPRLIRFQNGDKDDCRIENLCEGFYLDTKFDHSSKDGRSEYQKSYRSERRDHFRHKERERKFGVGLREYEAMFVSQGGKCAICQCEETATRNGSPISLAVDHNHSTGKVRQLLCAACNKAIGLMKEDRNILLSTIQYLDKHSEQSPNVVSLTPKG